MPRRLSKLVSQATALAAFCGAVSAEAGVTKGPYLQDVRSNEAEVRIEVSPPTPATLQIFSLSAKDGGAGKLIGPLAHAESGTASMHSLHVTGLSPATTYRYVVTAGGETRDGSVTTAPADDAKAPFSFLIYGDNRSNDDAHAAIVKDLVGAPGDFLVNSGDMVENGALPELWQRFFDIEGPLLRDRCLFAAIGNHELIESSGSSFLRYFGEDSADVSGVRKLYRTVRWENTRFFFLNGTDEFTGSDERRWIDGELGKSDNEPNLVWRIVVVHYGPWSSSLHGNNARLWNGGMLDVFKAHHIDLIVSGHDHVYERGESQGLLYIVSGGGGAPLYPIGDPLKSTRKGESTYHYIEAKIDGDTFSMTAKRVDGSLLDACGFKKGSGWSCDATSKPSGASSTTTQTSSSGDAKSSQNPEGTSTTGSSSKCGCEMPGRRSGRAPLAWIAAIVTVALLRRRKR